MKILVLSCQTETLVNFRLDMMKAFVEAGCDVVAVGHDPSEKWRKIFEQTGVEYRAVTVERNGMNPFADLKALKGYEKVIKETKPDKIFAYQAKAVIYGCKAAKKCGVKEVYPLIAGLGYAFTGGGFKRKILRFFMSNAYKKALKNSSAVIFHNSHDRDEFIRRGIAEEKRTSVINGSGVNTEVFKPREKNNDTDDSAARFIMVARIIKDKGIREYLEAARALRKSDFDVKCTLAGGFDTNPSAMKPEDVEPYVADGSATYLGEVKNVAEILRENDIFVLPSYHEGRPKAVLEAMACGLAVITTGAPGCRECVENGENGILVEPRSPEALVKAMRKLAAEPELVKSMGKASRCIAEEKYDVRKVNRRIMRIMGIEE